MEMMSEKYVLKRRIFETQIYLQKLEIFEFKMIAHSAEQILSYAKKLTALQFVV